MPHASRLALPLLAALLAAGCAGPPPPAPQQLEGPTDGYVATNPYLKVWVRSNATGDTLGVNFDRREWYVWGIAERMDARDVPYLEVQALPRGLLREFVAQSVASPSELEAYRYANMRATAEERGAMDAAYDALLERAPPPLPDLSRLAKP